MSHALTLTLPQEPAKSVFQDFPAFRPAWWLPGGHLQTIAAAFNRDSVATATAQQIQIILPDGDVMVLHDDRPETWNSGDRVAVLIHGMGGSHRSGPITRIARRLNRQGVRTFRVDLRGSGAGELLANRSYHAGCTEDLACVMAEVSSRTTGQRPSPIVVIGISLGGNILLKYLGEHPDWVPSQVEKTIAINPPIDLVHCVDRLSCGLNWIYNRYFARDLLASLIRRKAGNPNLILPTQVTTPSTMYEFDEWYTARNAGYHSANDYYTQCSALPFLKNIQIPTLIITSRNDPLIPVGMFEESRSAWSNSVELRVVDGGGHIGYYSRSESNGSGRNWLENRVVECTIPPPIR